MQTWPDQLEVVVEVPRGAFLKRDRHGTIDYLSPLPSPFNYGCAPAHTGGDGMPLDVVLLGPRRERGATLRAPVLGVVHFVDAGEVDTKVICGSAGLSRRDEHLVAAFFRGYALAKRALNALRRRGGPTQYHGLERRPRGV